MYFSLRFFIIQILIENPISSQRAVFAYTTTCEPVISLDTTPSVRIPDVAVFRGSTTVSYGKNKPIHQYLGIPYAEPPLGPLRFKPPVPFKRPNLEIEFNAKYFKPKCPQLVDEEDEAYLSKNYQSAEDCLYLNVFTVETRDSKVQSNLPVMVYIHGGGYYQGSALDFCPNYLLDHDMILVTMQYRLGPLGFLNLQDDLVSGNMGLLDQLEALEWISRNIKYFGGDNQRITLAGQSSGANSVSLMLVSPLVRPDLFQQAIIQSGNLFGEWSIDYHPQEHAIEFAKYVNCTQANLKQLVDCLMEVTSYDLIKANLKFMEDRILTRQQIVREIGINHATIQTTKVSKNFLNADPRENMNYGKFQKVPLLTGVTKDEGSMLMQAFVEYVIRWKFEQLNPIISSQIQYVKHNLFYDYVRFIGVPNNEIRHVELAKSTFLPVEHYDSFNSTIPGLVDLAGAIVIKSPVLQLARLMFQYSPTYLYSFHFKGSQTKLGYGSPVKYNCFDGVAHSDDLIYLFPFKNQFINKKEQQVVEHMTSLWANFVISDGKNISIAGLGRWPFMWHYDGPYLEINDKLTVMDNFLNDYMNHVDDPTFKNASLKTVIINLFGVLFYLVFFYTNAKLLEMFIA